MVRAHTEGREEFERAAALEWTRRSEGVRGGENSTVSEGNLVGGGLDPESRGKLPRAAAATLRFPGQAHASTTPKKR